MRGEEPMRINAHAHIFNLRSVFTKETSLILLNRLKLDGMPKFILEVLHDQLGKYLAKETDAEEIFAKLDDRAEVSKELIAWVEKLRVNDVSIDLEIDGVLAKLGAEGARYLREKILDLYDLDEDGEIKQDWLDYVEFLRIALLPSIGRVADVVRRQMKPDDGLVALMMDITDGSDDDNFINQQTKETSDVVLAYPGAVFPFFMVNPARPSHFQLMKNAIETQGFWGVKLYPSLGYPVISDAMVRVYEYCQTNRVPILTHCSSGGFYKNEQTSNLSSPAPWRDVLDSFKKLKICFGHFGGDESLVQEEIPPDSWTRSIIDLMRDFEGVYADIAYHSDPILGNEQDGIGKQQARQNYVRNIKALLKPGPTRDRILFGTDYWMVRMVSDDQDYWTFFQKLFTAKQFQQLTEINPAEYLGLPGSKVPSDWLLKHHVDFFNAKKMRVQREPVKWLEEAAAAILGPDRRFVAIGTGPSWSRHNYMHRILYEYLWGEGMFRKEDREANLPFEEYGRFKLVNLKYWDESPEPAAFDTAVRLVASNINDMVIKRYTKWTDYNKKEGITPKKARQRLINALKNMDWYVYQLADLCDKLYIFNSELPKEDDA
ncbi:MAG: amidohydrolase family protein [Thermodesulfobacteriota bacterium]|nr:amidohydrolase family protein [Thermodesulfobacteriota bacterium]